MSAASDPRESAFADLDRQLAQLLSLLDTPAADAQAIERATVRLAVTLADLRTTDHVDTPASRVALSRATQMTAVARELVTHRFERVETRLAFIRSARRAMQRGPVGDGTACDVAG